MTMTLPQKYEELSTEHQQEVIRLVETLWEAENRPASPEKPVFGSAKGQFFILPDFDAPLEDFAAYQ